MERWMYHWLSEFQFKVRQVSSLLRTNHKNIGLFRVDLEDFLLNHWLAFSKVCSTFILSSSKLFGSPICKNWTSSAYMTTFEFSKYDTKSFVKIKNKIGPRSEPCITPWVIASVVSPPRAFCRRPFSQSWNQCACMPYQPSLSRSLRWFTLSNALEVSVDVKTPTLQISCCLFRRI